MSEDLKLLFISNKTLSRNMKPEFSILDAEYEVWRRSLLAQITRNKAETFRFFLVHSDKFNYISHEDQVRYIKHLKISEELVFQATFTSFIAVFYVDQVLFRFKYKHLRSTSLKSPLTWLKYIGIPFVARSFTDLFLCGYPKKIQREIEDKYNLGDAEVQNAMKLFDEAYQEGTLDKLIVPRPAFWWKTNPEETQNENANQDDKPKET